MQVLPVQIQRVRARASWCVYHISRVGGIKLSFSLSPFKMTDYADSNGRGLDLKDSLVCSGWEPLDLVNTVPLMRFYLPTSITSLCLERVITLQFG